LISPVATPLLPPPPQAERAKVTATRKIARINAIVFFILKIPDNPLNGVLLKHLRIEAWLRPVWLVGADSDSFQTTSNKVNAKCLNPISTLIYAVRSLAEHDAALCTRGAPNLVNHGRCDGAMDSPAAQTPRRQKDSKFEAGGACCKFALTAAQPVNPSNHSQPSLQIKSGYSHRSNCVNSYAFNSNCYVKNAAMSCPTPKARSTNSRQLFPGQPVHDAATAQFGGHLHKAVGIFPHLANDGGGVCQRMCAHDFQ